jgi:hypothetical protein
MEQSAFVKWIDKYFKGIVIKIVEKTNGKPDEMALTYMFKTMLRKEFSITGKWETINTLNTRVSADMVAMDSSLPLKRRDSISKASGDIPKCGMELWLNETQLTELDTLIATKVDDKIILAKLFQDLPRVITGVYELNEQLFLEGLSTGVIAVEDSKKTGVGIRLDFGYLNENKFGVSVLWDDATAKPLDDLATALKKAKHADGNTITDVYMNDITFNKLVKTDQVKEYFAFSIGFFGDKTIVPVPTLEKINAALKSDNKYKFEIHIVDRTIVVEKNGERTTVTPWSEGKIILTTSKEVGVLMHAPLAEQNHPVAGVSYQTADNYILVSKYRHNKPSLSEYTTSQARVIPVICNVEQIYQIDTNIVVA